jgi:hypothetical protein
MLSFPEQQAAHVAKSVRNYTTTTSRSTDDPTSLAMRKTKVNAWAATAPAAVASDAGLPRWQMRAELRR